jgi:hypothetical protein
MKKLFALMILAALVLTGCNKDKVTNLDEKIIGKWMTAERDGQPALTNEKSVITFITPSQATISVSFNSRPELEEMWNIQTDVDVVIEGNKVTMTRHNDEHTTVVDEFTVTSIKDREMKARVKGTLTVDGKVVSTSDKKVRFVKVLDDYSSILRGTWEGRMTSDQSEFDDGEEHRWEFNADGTYAFYFKNADGQWERKNDVFSQFFVDGKLLCARWLNSGENQTENREWWEIASLDNGVMNWTALRKNNDGTTYTATFSMRQVQ